MNNYHDLQENNRMKSIKAFDDFLECYNKADQNYKRIIEIDVVGLILAKTNLSAEANAVLKQAIEARSMIG